MRLAALFSRASQAQNFTYNRTNDLGRTGSWTAFALASIAASALVISAGCQNVAHAYSLGLASSEFRALVLAAASAGASILGPFCWVAVFRGRGFGPRTVALLLALGCLAYASLCSLGFTAGSRDTAVSERSAAADAYGDQRAVAEAARAELAALSSVKTASRTVVERRRELAKLLAGSAVPSTGGKPVQADPQAAALGFYIRAAGWTVTDQAVGTWLSLGMVLFLEMAAALSLTVAAALRPVAAPTVAALPVEPQLPAEPEKPVSDERRGKGDDKDDPPAPPPRKGKPGRPRDRIPSEVIDRLRASGGKASGSVTSIGRLLGAHSKTTAHRWLHELAGMGAIKLTATPHGIAVALA